MDPMQRANMLGMLIAGGLGAAGARGPFGAPRELTPRPPRKCMRCQQSFEPERAGHKLCDRCAAIAGCKG